MGDSCNICDRSPDSLAPPHRNSWIHLWRWMCYFQLFSPSVFITKLREGYVFTLVCNFVQGDVWVFCLLAGYAYWGRVWHPMVLTSSGGHQSGRYASYWNVFYEIYFLHNNLCSTWFNFLSMEIFIPREVQAFLPIEQLSSSKAYF